MLLIDNTENTANAMTEGVASPDSMEAIKNLSLEEFIHKLVTSMVDFAFHLVVAILVFYVGKLIISRMYRFTARVLERRAVDNSLSSFILSLVRMLLYFLLIITVIGIIGINTSSFIALFASAGVAIGMALSGTLQNFAGGVLILLLKPYKVNDYIEASGFAGTVTEIQIFSTIITTPDNKVIYIPNGALSTGSINNWSRGEYRRVEWEISLSYGDNVAKAREAIIDMLSKDSRVVKTTLDDDREERERRKKAENVDVPQEELPKKRGFFKRLFGRQRARMKSQIKELDSNDMRVFNAIQGGLDRQPVVVLKSLADSSVVISARAWVLVKDYWTVYYEYNERFYNELPDYGLSFPFPQLDVHVSAVKPSADSDI
ncbi:MAG: mechanosensitive ion channel [Paramuribaculum sp.]|nr:mechanosensitive ion channel [Paramuribaculum sp.]